MYEPLPDDVAETIARCADAVEDLVRLKDELHVLRLSSDPRAQFSASLFDLERARRGDPEAREVMLEVADSLLVFWREGTGDELANVHPVLAELWASAASMLATFEVKRFERALADCWAARTDPPSLLAAMDALLPEGNRRVEFARCLYHLELARQRVDASRAAFAQRVGLLADAWRDREVARQLISGDAGLAQLWDDVVPYLDEFFEHLEEQAARRAKTTGPIPRPSRPEVKTDPELTSLPPPPPLGAEVRNVPSFRTLTGQKKDFEAAVTPVGSGAVEVTPPAQPAFEPDAIIDEAEVLELPPPPPPADKPSTGEVEIVEALEDDSPPPPPPNLTPARGLAAAIDQSSEVDLDEPDDATLAFWAHTFENLQLLPDDGQADEERSSRLLAIESRADRKRLNDFVDTLGKFMEVREARAMACLIRLMLAGQTKEKSLFGQANPRRAEALQAALAFLNTTPTAVGHVAVWFELDGVKTMESLNHGLELAWDYVSFCHRAQKDPLNPATVAAYTRT